MNDLGFKHAQDDINKITQFPDRFAGIINQELRAKLEGVKGEMKQFQDDVRNLRFTANGDRYGYLLAYRIEMELYLIEYDRLERLLSGSKADKGTEPTVSLAVYFKHFNAQNYLLHRTALKLFFEKTKKDKKHRIMSVWHYYKRKHHAICDTAETPYKFSRAIHCEFFGGMQDGSAHQGTFKEALCEEYEAILKAL